MRYIHTVVISILMLSTLGFPVVFTTDGTPPDFDTGPGLNQTQFVLIGTNGLTTRNNAYVWSMANYRGRIYIGIGKIGTIPQPIIIYLVERFNISVNPEYKKSNAWRLLASLYN